ncbi:MAG: hypothetical protein JW841_16145, partial [Deltaproteobacteria bacterium]|nr:hypothetical protein [Deltaproteobacteria bacterium]
ITGLSSDDAFVLVGYPGMGVGNGSMVVSNLGVADATVLIVDGNIVGPRTSSSLGRTISTNEIEDGAVTAAKLAVGAVSSSALGASVVGYDNIADGAVSASKVSFNYAGSDSPGGVATSAKTAETANTANSATTAGTASDVTFNYAGSNSKGGAATGLSCSGCISSGEVSKGAIAYDKLATRREEIYADARSLTEVCSNYTSLNHAFCFITEIGTAHFQTGNTNSCRIEGTPGAQWRICARSGGNHQMKCNALCF